MNNLGIPPLAGLCSYEEAIKTGYSVEHNVNLLKRYNFVKKKLVDIYAAHLACTAEWEVKCAFSLHMWLDAEHSSNLRKRVSEMREPPLGMDKVPDDKLELLIEEVIRAQGTLELLTGIYCVVKPAMLSSLRKHVSDTNPVADHPTYRMLKQMITEEEEMIAWGEQAVKALILSQEDHTKSTSWSAHLQTFLNQAGGIHGDPLLAKSVNTPKVTARNDGKPYEMDAKPQRDARFTDPFNSSAKIDEYYRNDQLQADERVFALIYKRLREMDVPEWMGPIIYKTKGKPWEYYHDLSRQQWDESRHAMLGEIGMYLCGVEYYKYPIDLKSSLTLNTMYTPKEAHAVLWGIEQSLMNKETGKRWEWLIAKKSNIPYGELLQDYDWADEVLHAQIGRKWLLPEFSSQEELNDYAEKTMSSWSKCFSDTTHKMSEHQEWWADFVKEARKHLEKSGVA
jgi:hypothetical protein